MGRLTAIFLFCAMLTCRASQGGTVFVNNLIGDDRANGLDQDVIGTQGGPVATVARALRIAKASDTIWIANTGTPYDESILIDWPGQGGTGLYPLVIDGHGAVFRGTRRVPADVWQRVGEGTYRYQPYRKGHYQLLVGDAPAAEAKVQRFQDLKPLEWCALAGHVYFRVEPTRFIDQYEIEAPIHEIGLGIHNGRNVTVRNIRFEAFRLDGIHVSGNSRNIRLEHVQSTANGRSGLAVSGTSQVRVGGVELSGNRSAGQLVLRKGKVTEIPAAELPPAPAPMSWDESGRRYVRLMLNRLEESPTMTTRRDGDAATR